MAAAIGKVHKTPCRSRVSSKQPLVLQEPPQVRAIVVKDLQLRVEPHRPSRANQLSGKDNILSCPDGGEWPEPIVRGATKHHVAGQREPGGALEGARQELVEH